MIVRPDGTPLYNFASVVDDVEMEITHVVRAEEHLSNTFPQLLVFEALGATLPAVCPRSLRRRAGLEGEDVQAEARRVREARASWSIFTSTSRRAISPTRSQLPGAAGLELRRLAGDLQRAELIEKFTLEKVNSSPASHDQDKLFWIEGEWMKTLPLEQKVEGVLPFLKSEGLVANRCRRPRETRIEAVIQALGDRLKVFSDILKLGRYFFSREMTYDPDAVKKRLRKEGVAGMLAELDGCSADVEPYDVSTLEKAVHDYAERTGRKMGDVVNPLAGGRHGAGGRAGALRLPRHPGARRLPSRIAQTLEMLVGRIGLTAQGHDRYRPMLGAQHHRISVQDQRGRLHANFRDRLDRLRLHHGLPRPVSGPHPAGQDARAVGVVPGRFADAAGEAAPGRISLTTWGCWANGRSWSGPSATISPSIAPSWSRSASTAARSRSSAASTRPRASSIPTCRTTRSRRSTRGRCPTLARSRCPKRVPAATTWS